MKALIFAAGLGERMRPLSDQTPKPLLKAGGKRLIEWHLERLAASGVREVAVNTSHLADQFPRMLGDGARYGVRIEYSYEGETPLETGGGMLHALPMLGREPFIAVNGDIWTDFDFASLPREPNGLAHLVLVDNPPQHAQGDFGIDAKGALLPFPDSPGTLRALTFAGIGVYRPELLDDWQAVIGDAPGANDMPPCFSIVPLLRAAMSRDQIDWQQHHGAWFDVGTPQRLQELDARLWSTIMQIDLATSNDCCGIAEVHVASWQKAYAGIFPDEYLSSLSVLRRAEAWQTIFAAGATEVLIARQRGRIAGFVSFGASRDPDALSNHGEISAIYVLPGLWSTGVGLALWKAAEQGLQSQGFSQISAWVISTNARAIRFYKSLGFREEFGSTKQSKRGGIRFKEVRYIYQNCS